MGLTRALLKGVISSDFEWQRIIQWRQTARAQPLCDSWASCCNLQCYKTEKLYHISQVSRWTGDNARH